jgi:hypothetical protein
VIDRTSNSWTSHQLCIVTDLPLPEEMVPAVQLPRGNQ